LSIGPSGVEVEEHVRTISALLGIADFVYLPSVVSKGNATREVSDGLLICSHGAAILQVKSRARSAAASDNAEDAQRWLRREYESAIRQGEGTRRTIGLRWAGGDPVLATAVRALAYPSRHEEFAVELGDPASWPIVVVLDHPAGEETDLPRHDHVFVVSLEDWEDLNHHVRSVNGLLRYISRVLEAQIDGTVPFGRERDRFYQVAEADSASASAREGSVPWFAVDGSHEDLGVALYRELLERVWLGDARGPALSATECRLVLDFLDDVPVAMQARVGRWVLSKRRKLSATGSRQSGLVILGNRPMIFVCDVERNEPEADAWNAELGALTAVRIAEWAEQRSTLTSAVCVGVREMREGVEYTHIYASHELGALVPTELRRSVEERYGVPHLSSP
jgi:hypothetical protein